MRAQAATPVGNTPVDLRACERRLGLSADKVGCRHDYQGGIVFAVSREHEHTLNVWLASHLKRLGLDAKPESRKPKNRRLDIEINIGPARIAIEAEHGHSNAKKFAALRDADARLQQELAQCAIAICYPDDTNEESLPSSQLLWSVRDPAAPTHKAAVWNRGNLEQLVSVIRLTPAQLGDPDSVAAALSSSLDGAVARLSERQKQALAQALDLPVSTKGPKGRPWDPAAKRALLVIVTAVMFHARLDSFLQELKPERDNRTDSQQPFEDNWPPAMAQQCAIAADPIREFGDAWNLILALDYKPIFETGRAALYSCPNDPAFATAVQDSARAALAVVRNIAGLRHDLLGRIFHSVLDTARYDGSFYTTTSAATLLATLAIDEGMCDWEDPEAISRLRIVDPACGTGTLLMAAAERIRNLAPQLTADEKVAAALIEQVLSGYDVNLTATHMAATTLGLLSPTTRFQTIKIGRAFLGVDDLGKAFLGSLEFLDRQPWLLPWPKAVQAVSHIDTGEQITKMEPADLVIMNPPFTRDSLRHDQFTREEELAMKAREKELFASEPVHLSGNSGPFLVLADFVNKSDSGTMGAVLPLVTATNASSRDIRKFLANRYHIETLVTSHDPERIYFSENTTIGEMLLICRRWPSDKGSKPPTRVINLAVNPSSPSTAISAAHTISIGSVAASRIGTIQEWPEEKILDGDWGAVQFLSPYLCATFAALNEGGLFSVVRLGTVSKIGPAGQRIRDAFTRSDFPDTRGRIGLWHHDTERVQAMATTWDTHISAKPPKTHLADSYWKQRSKFFLPNRFRLNTVRVSAVRLDTPAIGSAWTPCRLAATDAEVETLQKALCVYLNSSIGILALLGNRSNTTPAYPRFSLDDLRKLLVPDFVSIGSKAADALAKTYDALAKDVLLPLPQMNECDVRRLLDDAIISELDLDEELIATIRRSLAAEPSITAKRYSV